MSFRDALTSLRGGSAGNRESTCESMLVRESTPTLNYNYGKGIKVKVQKVDPLL